MQLGEHMRRACRRRFTAASAASVALYIAQPNWACYHAIPQRYADESLLKRPGRPPTLGAWFPDQFESTPFAARHPDPLSCRRVSVLLLTGARCNLDNRASARASRHGRPPLLQAPRPLRSTLRPMWETWSRRCRALGPPPMPQGQRRLLPPPTAATAAAAAAAAAALPETRRLPLPPRLMMKRSGARSAALATPAAR